MMHARSKRRPDEKAGRWVKLTVLWGFTGVSLCGFGVGAVMMNMRPPDPYLLCQRSAVEATATTTIMVDSTDPFTSTQKNRVRTTIEKERDRLPKGGRLTILSLNPATPWEPIEHLSICNPGTAAGENKIFVTVARIERRWREHYADLIEAAIAKAIEGPASPNSPIITSLAAVLTRPDFDARVHARRLVLISDLLEHERGYSQLKGGDFWGMYRVSPLPQAARFDLRGIAIAVDYLSRGEHAAVQGPKHQEFWRRLFNEAGAPEVTFIGQLEKELPDTKSGERLVKQSGR